MSNELKTIINSDAMRDQFSRALPKHLPAERFARIAITALSKTPKLQECTKESVMKCLLDCSALGIEPDGRRAYLIPYGKECTLIVSYIGLIELIRRSGDVTSIRAETVCENDEFSWSEGVIKHQVNWRKPRGAVECVYAEAKMKSGEVQTAVMTLDEIEGIRKRSKAANSGPWVSDWSEMAKKTVVRRLSKMLPLSYEVMSQVTRDDDQFEGMRNVTRQAPVFALPQTPTPNLEETRSKLGETESQPSAEPKILTEEEAWGESK